MKKIILLIYILIILFLVTINTYAIDMPGITSNGTITNTKSNTNILTDIKNSIINYENDDVMYYSVIAFVSISFISLFIIYKMKKDN